MTCHLLRRRQSFPLLYVPGNGHLISTTTNSSLLYESWKGRIPQRQSRSKAESEYNPFTLISYMKPKAWEGNTSSFSVTYHINHDGPNYFVTHYKGSCKGHLDPKEAWRVNGVAKFTDSAQEMKKWCIETFETYDKELKAARKDTSFASEVESEQDPTANTKMVT